jgi:hypothetical protein
VIRIDASFPESRESDGDLDAALETWYKERLMCVFFSFHFAARNLPSIRLLAYETAVLLDDENQR